MSLRLFLRASKRLGAYKHAKKARFSDAEARAYSDTIYPPTEADLAYEAASVRRPSAGRRLFKTYIAVGLIWAAPMGASYLFVAAYSLWVFGLTGGLYPSIFALTVGAASAILRVIDWLPALLLWALTDNTYSFWDWLAPGFDVEIIAPVKSSN